MIKTENFAQVVVASADELRAWLREHHAQEESVWLVTYKKQVLDKYVSVQEVLDELLCFGWIDGIRRKLNDRQTMQLIAPRRAQHWAKTYKDRAAKLIAEDRMHPSGLAAIERSKTNGMWSFMDDVDARIIPEDFGEALDQRPPARESFTAFAPSTQRFILRWIKLAKTEATRKRRIEKAAMLAQQGKKIPGS
ncbi:YdeI family protein [Lewinella sp. W8]|uniref:YdeI/OmpD-associated family protein n=1 Tax=Lewinella sp. W8 TaxID=2528208 RepID=UPI0010689690|nr:YdeI/OmpD-associated family protein [Lewinella sp. W8]MTB52507.1 hypothetical protein [Lewinella sp. W8]